MGDDRFRTVSWEEGRPVILDQTLLPQKEAYLAIESVEQMAEAIRSLRVRGAPALGIAAAYGVALAAFINRGDRRAVLEACDLLASTRPTAVNLFWALQRMRDLAVSEDISAAELPGRLLKEAEAIAAEQDAADRRLGELGAELLPSPCRVITHCNAGGLATLSYGTALGVVKAAYRQGKVELVWVDETRPLLQGARLTAWELERAGIPYRVICEGMAGSVLARGMAEAVITGADRVAANGDVANKIGTYPLAVLAARHRIPFYVAAPLSTLDLSLEEGAEIPIEERSPEEVRTWRGVTVTPPGAPAWNPAFDVTPAELITAIITEAGVAYSPFRKNLRPLAEGTEGKEPGEPG